MDRDTIFEELYEFFILIDGGYSMDFNGEKIVEKVMEIVDRAVAEKEGGNDA